MEKSVFISESEETKLLEQISDESLRGETAKRCKGFAEIKDLDALIKPYEEALTWIHSIADCPDKTLILQIIEGSHSRAAVDIVLNKNLIDSEAPDND